MSLFGLVYSDVIKETVKAGEFGYCVTLESVKDPNHWIQETGQYINCSYPYSQEPTKRLEALGIVLPDALVIHEWKSGSYVTLAHYGQEESEAVDFLRQYTSSVFGLTEQEDQYRRSSEWL